MPNFIKTGRIIGVAALAASTALSGPVAALAQQPPMVRMAQADAPPPEAAPADPQAERKAKRAERAAKRAAGGAEAPAGAEQRAPDAAQAAPAAEPSADRKAKQAERAARKAAREAAAPDAAPAADAPPAVAADPAANPARAERKAKQAERAARKAAQESAPAGAEAPPSDEAPAPAQAAPAQAAPPSAAGSPTAAEPASKADKAAQRKANQAERKARQAARDKTATPDAATSQGDVPDARKGRRGDKAGATAGAAPAEPNADAAAQTPAAQAPAAQAPAATSQPAVPPRARKPKPVAADIQNEAVPTGGVAASDARVQQLSKPIDVPSVKAVRGKRIDAPTRSRTTINNNTTTNNTTINNTTVNNTAISQTQLPPGAKVVDRVGDRDIISIVGAGVAGAVAGGVAGYFIRGNDDERLATNAKDHYYEQLPERRRRETVVRENGTQVVTITNRYGDVIQRSKILPGGREVVLFYDPYQRDDDAPQYYTDPGADLPPIDLEIPRDEYIVAPRVPDEDLYYRTMVAPPVETVERIYSIDEVRRSERIRDKVRRIDLNTINFDFGSDAIAQNQVPNLEALADAIAKIVDKNPAETFLIEGHTDAVGSEVANLALSDRRAEQVAATLSQYFDVPPENLITQGYGESDLKVNTQGESAENRRVTVRRITALVKPVNTAER